VIKGQAATRSVALIDISAVAKAEHARLFGPPSEPEEVTAIRHHASEEARSILADAYREGQEAREEAKVEGYQDGFAEGRAAGLAAAAAEVEENKQAMRELLARLTERVEIERAAMWNQAEPQILEMVLDISRKVIKDEAEVNRKVVVSVLKNALRRVVERDNIRIRVNEADAEAVKMSRQDMLALLDGAKNFEIVEDRRVSPGGVVVETGGPSIDARIDTQLAEVEQIVRAQLEEAA
jgi:flagellar assembly protein FliH